MYVCICLSALLAVLLGLFELWYHVIFMCVCVHDGTSRMVLVVASMLKGEETGKRCELNEVSVRLKLVVYIFEWGT